MKLGLPGIATACSVQGKVSYTPQRQAISIPVPCRADAVRTADVPAARAFVKIRATRSRKGLAMWLADERVGTFVVLQQGRRPGKGDLWQMRMLHEHDEKVASSSAQSPPVRDGFPCAAATCCTLQSAAFQ